MSSSFFTEFEERSAEQGKPGIKFSRTSKTIPSEQKSFKYPPTPGKPRKVFKALGKKVKTAVEGNI